MSELKVPAYAVHNTTKIAGFFGEYRFLSNFWPCVLWYESLKYPSAENAYQAAKIRDHHGSEGRKQFIECGAGEAKRLGNRVPLRSDWEQVKTEIMCAIVFDKFWRNLDLRDKLLDTRSAVLIEANHWNDRFWGVDETGEGKNTLGRILMLTRQYFLGQKVAGLQ